MSGFTYRGIAKSKDFYNEWVYGNYANINEEDYIILTNGTVIPVRKETVGVSTGVYDESDINEFKMIFEGDNI